MGWRRRLFLARHTRQWETVQGVASGLVNGEWDKDQWSFKLTRRRVFFFDELPGQGWDEMGMYLLVRQSPPLRMATQSSYCWKI